MKLGKRGFFPSSTTWKCCLYKDLSLIPKAPAPGVNPTPGSASRAVGITCPCLPGPGGCQEQNPSVISWKHIPKVPKVVDAEPSSTTGLGVIVAARVWSERISPALLAAHPSCPSWKLAPFPLQTQNSGISRGKKQRGQGCSEERSAEAEGLKVKGEKRDRDCRDGLTSSTSASHTDFVLLKRK